MSAILQTFRESLAYIGYGPDLIRDDYEYATLNRVAAAGEKCTSQIEMAAFCRYPTTYQDACIGVTFTNGARGRDNIARHKYLGAPLVFEIDDGSRMIRPWSIRVDGPHELRPAFPFSKVSEVFAQHEHSWGLLAMRALKRAGAQAVQTDFYDVLRLPKLDSEFQSSLRHLLEGVIDKIQNAYSSRFNCAPQIDHLFPYLFRFLTAKVFLDRQDVAGWTPNLSPLELYQKADSHLAAPRAIPVPEEFFDAGLVESVWKSFSAGLGFQNISAAALAYIYESCFIDKATRVQLSIHSSPPELVDIIVSQLPIEKLPDSGRKVMEPFCGSGVFLAAAMRRLGELNEHNLVEPQQRHEYFKKRLVGIEFEPLAMEVCRLRLTLSDYPMGNGWNLHQKDVFQWPEWEQELKSTDILLANPPFHAISPSMRKLYQATKPVMPAELLQRVIKHPPALVGLILPPSFLTGPEYREANRTLANAYKRVEYIELPDSVFRYAGRDTVAVLCSDRRNTMSIASATKQVTVIAKRVNKHCLADFYRSGIAPWEKTQVHSFSPTQQLLSIRVDPPAAIWEILDGAPKLVDVVDEIHQGLHWRMRTDKLPQTAPRTDVVSPVHLDGYHLGCEKMKGCLRQFKLCPPQFLSRRPEDQHRGHKAWMFPWEKPKVVCNRGRFQRGSPWRLASFADEIGLAFSQAYLALWPAADIGLYALAAVLCGPLANAFVADRDVGADTRISTLKKVPLPPRFMLVPGGPIDLLSRKLHEMYARAGEYSLHTPDDALLNETILRLDAAVLEAYDLPEECEQKLLGLFSDKDRPLDSFSWQHRSYIDPKLKDAISLKDYLAITLDWEKTNHRRGELIDKEYTLGRLNEADTAELDRLQRLANHFIGLEGIYQDLNTEKVIRELKAQGLWTE